MNLEAMRAFLKERKPDGVIPFEQYLVDLGVYDGMPIPAGDVATVVPRVQAKLSAFANPQPSDHAEAPKIDFKDPVVGVDHELKGGAVVVTLRISAERIG